MIASGEGFSRLSQNLHSCIRKHVCRGEYRDIEHPDWALVIPGRDPIRCRNQLVLDFSRKEMVDHIYEQITNFDEARG